METEFINKINNLDKQDLIKIIKEYRRTLQEDLELLRAFAQENFAKDILHKLPCGYRVSTITNLLYNTDYILNKETTECG